MTRLITATPFSRRRFLGSAGALGALGFGLSMPRRARAVGTGYVYVSNEKSHDLYVLHPETFDVVTTIRTSRRPRDMHFNNAHTQLLVACGDDDVIDVIDVASNAVIDQIPTGPSPEVFAFNRDNSLIYVSNEENSTAQVIDVAQKIIVHEIPTGAEPEGVHVSNDGATVYVTSEVADMIHVIDGQEGYVTDNIIVGTRPRRFATTSDEREMWVSCELSSEIYIFDRTTLEVTDVLTFLPPGFRPVDVTPVGLLINGDDSTAVVTLGRANHIAFVDVATREITDYVLVGSRAWGVGLTRDERTLFVANGLSDDVTIIDMASRSVAKSVPVGRVPHSVVVDDYTVE